MGVFKNLSENARTYGYYSWLLDIIEIEMGVDDYYLLLKRLHQIPFVYVVDRDFNREEDARDLRDEYYRGSKEHEDGKTSVLEVLITLARHCSDQSMDGQSVSKWFWEFMHNLDLDQYVDFNYYTVGANDKVDKTIDILLQRCYEKNCRGGLFPLKEPKMNQQRVELWYQMSAYLQEKYRY